MGNKKCYFVEGNHVPCDFFFDSNLNLEAYQTDITVCPGCHTDLKKLQEETPINLIPDESITFYLSSNREKPDGRLYKNSSGKLEFEGSTEKSAEVLFKLVCQHWNKDIEDLESEIENIKEWNVKIVRNKNKQIEAMLEEYKELLKDAMNQYENNHTNFRKLPTEYYRVELQNIKNWNPSPDTKDNQNERR